MRGLSALDGLVLLGIDHRSCDGVTRGWIANQRPALERELSRLVSAGAITGAVVFSTCLRCELLLSGATDEAIAGIAGWMRACLASHGLDVAPVVRRGEAAVRHVLRVSGSLESLVPGEREVGRQVRKAFASARSAGRLDRVLNGLDRHAAVVTQQLMDDVFTDGRVRGFAREATSQVISRGSRTALVLGLGSIGVQVARGLVEGGVETIVASRHPRGPERLGPIVASGWQLGLDEALALAGRFEAVVVATAASKPVLLGAHVSGGRPFVVDLGTPPQVDVTVDAETQVIRLDSMGAPIDGTALAKADAIVESGIGTLSGWLQRRSVSRASSKASATRPSCTSV